MRIILGLLILISGPAIAHEGHEHSEPQITRRVKIADPERKTDDFLGVRYKNFRLGLDSRKIPTLRIDIRF